MGLGQSKQYRWKEPRYPRDFQPYQQPLHPFIPNYVPVGYAQPMYPQQGFIPPIYGQAAVAPPQQLHYFSERPRKRKTRRSARADTFVGGFIPPRDRPSPPETVPRRESHRRRETVATPVVPSRVDRNQTRRAPTPFIPPMAEEEEEVDQPRSVAPERERPASRHSNHSPRHYDQPSVTVQGNMSTTRRPYSSSRPTLRNPLPPPPKDVFEMTPYRNLSTLPQATALLKAAEENTVTVFPYAPNGTMERKKSIFRAFSRKDKKHPLDKKNPIFVYVPASSQQQQPPNEPRQSEARPQTRTRFQSPDRPFAGEGPRDISTPTTAEPTTSDLPTGGAYHSPSSSSSISDVLPAPIPPHPTNPPTTKFDQHQSYTQFMNHSPHRVIWGGVAYPTALHLHEALKFLDHRPDIAELIRKCSDVHEVYPLTAKYVDFIRPDWGEQFLPLMEEVLYAKFRQHPDLRVMLLGTGNADLEYADTVDGYWGSGADGQGANQLGKVLTQVREQLREDSTP